MARGPDYVAPLAAMNKTRSVFGVPLLARDKWRACFCSRARARTVHATPDRAGPDFRRPGGDRIENARVLTELRQRYRDLTESLEHLRAAQDRLVQTEKLASLGQLTAGIAHEIKNPLNFAIISQRCRGIDRRTGRDPGPAPSIRDAR